MFYLSKKEVRFLKDAIDPDRVEFISSIGYIRMVVLDGIIYFYTLDGYHIHAIKTNYTVPSQYENFLYQFAKDSVEPVWEDSQNQAGPWEDFPKVGKKALADTTKYRQSVEKYVRMFDEVEVSSFVNLVSKNKDFSNMRLPSKQACKDLAKSNYVAVIKPVEEELQFFAKGSSFLDWEDKTNTWVINPQYLRESVVGNSKIVASEKNKAYFVLNDVGFVLISGFGK